MTELEVLHGNEIVVHADALVDDGPSMFAGSVRMDIMLCLSCQPSLPGCSIWGHHLWFLLVPFLLILLPVSLDHIHVFLSRT